MNSSGSLVVVRGGRDVLEDRLEQRLEVVVVGKRSVGGPIAGCRARASGGVHDRHVQQGVDVEVGHIFLQVRGKPQQQVVGLLLDLGDAGVGPVCLVHEQDDGKLGLERLAQHEARLRQGALRGIHQQHHAVDHRQAALDLAAEIGVAGGVDDVDRHGNVGVGAVVGDRSVLREDRDALLALEIVRVHRALFDVRVLPERAGLAQHGVHEGRLAVIDVRDDRDVAEVRTEGMRHEGILAGGVLPGCRHPPGYLRQASCPRNR
jgi:hypothetical protein